MARTTTTIHTCDRCGIKVDRPKDLRRFDLWARGDSIKFDLCRTCEDEFLANLRGFASLDVERLVRD